MLLLCAEVYCTSHKRVCACRQSAFEITRSNVQVDAALVAQPYTVHAEAARGVMCVVL